MGYLSNIANTTMPQPTDDLMTRASPNAVASTPDIPVASKVTIVPTVTVPQASPMVRQSPTGIPTTTTAPVANLTSSFPTPTTNPAPTTPSTPATSQGLGSEPQSPTLSAQDAYNMYTSYNGGSGGYDVNNAAQMTTLGAGTTYISQLQNILSTPTAQNDSNPAYTWLTQNGYLTPASSSQSGNVELAAKGQDWMNVANQNGVLSQGNPWGATPYQGAGAGEYVTDPSKMYTNPNYGNLATPDNLSYSMDNSFGNLITQYGPALAGAALMALGIPGWALGAVNAADSLSNGGSLVNAAVNVGTGIVGATVPGASQVINGLSAADTLYNTIKNPGLGNLVQSGNTIRRLFPGD